MFGVTVPPARQCTLPDCEREAVNPQHPGARCRPHRDAADAGEPVTSAEESSGSTGSVPSGQEPDTSLTVESREHDNPVDVTGVTDAECAAMLREYLEAFGQVPRLMPLDEAAKAPVIQGKCRLDSPEGREHLVDGEEAIREIGEESARGFALYAGKHDHGTEDAVFVDHDDDRFPTPTANPNSFLWDLRLTHI